MYINGREVKFKVNKNILISYFGYNRYWNERINWVLVIELEVKF